MHYALRGKLEILTIVLDLFSKTLTDLVRSCTYSLHKNSSKMKVIVAILIICLIKGRSTAPIDGDDILSIVVASTLDSVSCSEDNPGVCTDFCELNRFEAGDVNSICQLRRGFCLVDSGECTCTYDCSYP